MPVKLTISVDSFALLHPFTISRGTRTEAVVVTVRLTDGEFSGWAECTPYPRYGESVGSVVQLIEDRRADLRDGLTREALQSLMPPGAARNAIDCALWDLEAKRSGTPVYKLAGLSASPSPLSTITVSLGTPDAMAEDAAREAHRPLLKIKFGGKDGDLERIKAVRLAAPDTTLICDANEGWTGDTLQKHLDACAEYQYALVE
ncbi:MAG: dipeptide epimerase, partial [Methylobacteriaceae bacterium]|nr:dipeptide epimerase [Methylobacteriaceae bacterium]